ncbi:MAG: hypothetical protein MHM6MM_005429 [Cercozoa sp. M6MM]
MTGAPPPPAYNSGMNSGHNQNVPWNGQGPNPGFNSLPFAAGGIEVELDSPNQQQPARIYINHNGNNNNGPAGADRPQRQLRGGHIAVLVISLAAQFAGVFMFYNMVLQNKKGFKGACFSSEDMDDYICVFAAGQFAKGIIALGQINFGLITVGQCSLGALFAAGQVAISSGYVPIAQVCFAGYNSLSMVGFGSYHVRRALIGFSGLKPYLFPGTTIVRTCTSDA